MQEESAESQPKLIRYNPHNSYLSTALATLRENGHPEYEEKIKNTFIGSASSLTDEEIESIQQILEPHQFTSFLSGYTEARWGADSASATWRGKEGLEKENISAKFLRRLTLEERNNFYFRMSKDEAQTFWNENKLAKGESPVIIELVTNEHPQAFDSSK